MLFGRPLSEPNPASATDKRISLFRLYSSMSASISAQEIEEQKAQARTFTGPTQPAMLWRPLPNLPQKKVVQCQLCAHYCIIKEGDVGYCLSRRNDAGKLVTFNWGQATSLAIDPIEKKPFFHFKPATRVLSFGTPTCNFRCLNCQNWELSQATRSQGAEALENALITPQQIAAAAARSHVDGVAYTYSEPTIFFEYARDTVKACRALPATRSLFHVFVSNGYFTPQMLEVVQKEKLLQAIRIDLKFMDEEPYLRITGGRLRPVQDSIRRVWEMRKHIHSEIINLIIPGENDSEDDFRRTAEFVHSISPDLPLHFTRFFPDYKMMDKPPTDLKKLQQAQSIAREAGCRYVYVGNTDLPGAEDTHCPKCSSLLISRDRFGVTFNAFEKLKKVERATPHCPKCGQDIAIVL